MRNCDVVCECFADLHVGRTDHALHAQIDRRLVIGSLN
jgi:hypothetical protein